MAIATLSLAPAAPVYSVPASLADVSPAQEQAWKALAAYVHALRDGVTPLTRLLSTILDAPTPHSVSDLNALVSTVSETLTADVRHLISHLPVEGLQHLELRTDRQRGLCVDGAMPVPTRVLLTAAVTSHETLRDALAVLEATARFVTLWRFTEASARAAWIDPGDSAGLWDGVQRLARRIERADCLLRVDHAGAGTLVLRATDQQVLSAWAPPKKM